MSVNIRLMAPQFRTRPKEIIVIVCVCVVCVCAYVCVCVVIRNKYSIYYERFKVANNFGD